MDRLKNKIGIVTGGGSGIGRGVALLFAKEGASVVIADIARQAGEETVDIIKQNGGKAIFIETNVTKAVDVEKTVRMSVDQLGKPNILCNCGGIIPKEPELISDLAEEEWERIININLKGVYLFCKYTIPEMINNGGSSIINISSLAGIIKAPNYAYAASKGGIIALTKGIALQSGKYDIRANVICPGSIDTPARAASRQIKKSSIDLAARILKKDGQPEDIGYAAVYLASDEAAFVTGAVFVIDGGSLRG